jgi:aminobenzoyl-glutamate utilization protein B
VSVKGKRYFVVFLILAAVLVLQPLAAVILASEATAAKETAVSWVKENAQHFGDVSRKLWEYAEVGLHEFKSSDLLVEELEKNGFKVERGQAGMPTAFVGTFTRGSGKPVIGIIAEFDALPNGHSCGHNLFGAGSVAAAIATKVAMEKKGIDGTVKLFGTPTEDTHGGKVWMAREGVFDGCDAILIWHPGTKNEAKYGSNLAVQILDVTFTGKSAHAGAAPEKGRSALDGLMIASMAMEFLREHMIEPMRIHYVISAGGQATNVVPDLAKMSLGLRGPKMADIEYLRSREGGIDDCLRAGALASGTDVTAPVVGAFYNLIPNKTGAYLLYENMKAIEPPKFTEEEQEMAKSLAQKYNLSLEGLDSTVYEPSSEMSKGSEDTGDVSYIAPVLKLYAACAAVGSPGHSPVNVEQYGSSIGQKGMVYAAEVLAATALDLLTDKDKLEAVQKEFEENLKGAEYHPVIAEDRWPPIPEQNPPDFKGPAPQIRPAPKAPESLLYWKKK